MNQTKENKFRASYRKQLAKMSRRAMQLEAEKVKQVLLDRKASKSGAALGGSMVGGLVGCIFLGITGLLMNYLLSIETGGRYGMLIGFILGIRWGWSVAKNNYEKQDIRYDMILDELEGE